MKCWKQGKILVCNNLYFHDKKLSNPKGKYEDYRIILLLYKLYKSKFNPRDPYRWKSSKPKIISNLTYYYQLGRMVLFTPLMPLRSV